jgi:hypothetical protein
MMFRKKPVVIEAMQFTNETKDQCFNFVTCNRYADFEMGQPVLAIQTLEGEMRATVGDWIVKGVKGEFYPVKPDIFEMTYEPAHLSFPTKVLESFNAYCSRHPTERFWQALRNWSCYDFILGWSGQKCQGVFKVAEARALGLDDTFYIEDSSTGPQAPNKAPSNPTPS